MTFSTEIAKRRTKRATLARINPARYISETLVSEGSGIYSMSNSLVISAIKRNGTALTADSTDPTVNDHYYYNETTGEITIKLASAPNGTTNVVIAYYYLFYTSGLETEYYETPTDSATTKRYWKPFLDSDSSFSTSFENIEEGIISIPDASITISNMDSDFKNYISVNDSFNNKSIDIWVEINDVFKKIYTGKVTSVPEISGKSVAISFSDQRSLLAATCLMGDDYDECYHISSNIPKKDLFKPIPMIMAEQSWYDSVSGYLSSIALYVTVPSEGLSAVCTSYNQTLSTSVNRTWTLCRTMQELPYQSVGTVEAALAVGLSTMLFRFSSYENLYAGDTLEWEEAAVTYYGRIMKVGTFTYSAVSYNVAVLCTGGAVSTSSSIASGHALSIMVYDSAGTWRNAFRGLDYSVNQVATAGGWNLVSILFALNVEASIGGPTPIDPVTFDVQYKIGAGQISHGTCLKNILDSSGISTNAASFTAADAAVSQYVSFSIPFKNENEYDNFYHYVQKILGSMLGYIDQNDDGEIVYYLLAAPSSSTTRDESHFTETTRTSIEYRDLITEIIPKNMHLPIIDSGVDGTSRSAKSKYLHDTNKIIDFEHVLAVDASGNISRQSEILALRSNRKLITSYVTETIDLDSVIGDDQTINDESLYGSTIDIKVIASSKSENLTKIDGTDLLGL